MRFLFEISKEHPKIPVSEILAVLQAEEIRFNIIEKTEDVLIIQTDSNRKKSVLKKIGNRLAFTFCIDEFLFSCPPNIKLIKKYAKDIPVRHSGSIAIRYKQRSQNIDSKKIVESLADIYTANRKVDLEQPDVEIRVVLTETKVYVGVKKIEINNSSFEQRKVQHRPFFSPVSLHPKLARALVNLSKVKKDETLVDPFCGTGGILLEAGLIGVETVGADIDDKMVEGCKKTLQFYKIKNYQLYHCDIGEINNKIRQKVDAVVTDLPYGRATYTGGEKVSNISQRAFKNIYKLLKNNRLAVIGFSDKEILHQSKKYFKLKDLHEFRAHRSLTRYFGVFQPKN